MHQRWFIVSALAIIISIKVVSIWLVYTHSFYIAGELREVLEIVCKSFFKQRLCEF